MKEMLNVVYAYGSIAKIVQRMTQEELASLLKDEEVTLICVNDSGNTKYRRKKARK